MWNIPEVTEKVMFGYLSPEIRGESFVELSSNGRVRFGTSRLPQNPQLEAMSADRFCAALKNSGRREGPGFRLVVGGESHDRVIIVQFQNQATKRFLDGRREGQKHDPVYTCDHGGDKHTHQRFFVRFHPANENAYKITHEQSCRLLDSNSDGKVYLFHEDNGGQHQQWLFENIPGDETHMRIRNRATGLLLDSNRDGDVYTLNQNGGPFQHWKWSEV